MRWPDFELFANVPLVTEYDTGYIALLQLGGTVKDEATATMLAHAVYGWMPTILKDFDYSKCDMHSIRAGKLPEHPFVNGSWVGTSKFLHMMVPDLFPIWDSRVAIHFGFQRRYQYEKREVYSGYVEYVHKLVGKVQNKTPWSDVRFIELCFYSARQAN